MTPARWTLVALFAVLALLVALTLQGLRSSSEPRALDPAKASVQPDPSSRSGAGPAATAEIRNETPPWQATPANTSALPPGTVPAWQVNPPPPDPSTPVPPPREPPNPAQHRPSMDNPGGVNGDRPERNTPSVE